MSTSQNHSANKATARALLCLFFPLGDLMAPASPFPASPLPHPCPLLSPGRSHLGKGLLGRREASSGSPTTLLAHEWLCS